MCGRFSLFADLGELAGRFEFDGDWDAFDARHNIAPTQSILTVVGGEDRRAGFMSRDAERLWLDDSVEDPYALSSLLVPYPSELMEAYEVSSLVNSVANDGPEVIEPVGGWSQGELHHTS